MRARLTLALAVDIAMGGCLLLGLAHPLTGNLTHETVGLSFFVLCGLHNALNWKWYTKLQFTSRAPRQRIGTVVNRLLMTLVVLFLATSLLHSQDLFPFFKEQQTLTTRKLHTTAAWWCLALVGFHVGLHCNLLMAALRKWTGISIRSRTLIWVRHTLAALTAFYGIYVCMTRDIAAKLLGLTSFEYWDVASASGTFFTGYAAFMGTCACIAHYGVHFIKKSSRYK